MNIATLEELKFYYDEQVSYVKRQIKYDPAKAPYWKLYLQGVYSAIDHFIQYLLPDKEFPQVKFIEVDLEKLSEDEKYFHKVAEIIVFNNVYDIYLDDYGQCYTVLIDGEHHSLGTYNTDIAPTALYFIFQHIHDKNFNELGE